MSKRAAEVVVSDQELGASAHRLSREFFEWGSFHVSTFYQNTSARHYQSDRVARGVETPSMTTYQPKQKREGSAV